MPRTPEPPEIPPAICSFTCDWGDCEEKTTAWRWSGQRLNESPLGWLPVCTTHASAADAVVAHVDGSLRPVSRACLEGDHDECRGVNSAGINCTCTHHDGIKA